MAMRKYFEDTHNVIKEQSCVAGLLLLEAKKLTKSFTGQDDVIDSVVMEVLTALVVKALDFEKIKAEYHQREHLREVEHQIEESVQQILTKKINAF